MKLSIRIGFTVMQCISEFSTHYGLVTSLFLLGFLGGTTHCSLMCAPFILAQTKDGLNLKRPSGYLLLPYHLGRMTTYVLLAIALSSVLHLAFLFTGLSDIIFAPILMLAGIIFIVTAFPRLSALWPWVGNVRWRRPHTIIFKILPRLTTGNSIYNRYFLGVLLGFMPCGLVISALLTAVTAPNALYAGLSMTAFTIGTMPTLIMVALGGQAIHGKYPLIANNLSKIAMVASSFWLFALAGIMIF